MKKNWIVNSKNYMMNCLQCMIAIDVVIVAKCIMDQFQNRIYSRMHIIWG